MFLGFLKVKFGGDGFIIIRVSKRVVIAGYTRIETNSIVEAKLCAAEVGLKAVEAWGISICTIFMDCKGLKQAPSEARCDNSWRFNDRIMHAKSKYYLENKHVIIPHS